MVCLLRRSGQIIVSKMTEGKVSGRRNDMEKTHSGKGHLGKTCSEKPRSASFNHLGHGQVRSHLVSPWETFCPTLNLGATSLSFFKLLLAKEVFAFELVIKLFVVMLFCWFPAEILQLFLKVVSGYVMESKIDLLTLGFRAWWFKFWMALGWICSEGISFELFGDVSSTIGVIFLQ